MYNISYTMNLFPGKPCAKRCKMENLTPQGLCILLYNLMQDGLKGIEIKNVTITKYSEEFLTVTGSTMYVGPQNW